MFHGHETHCFMPMKQLESRTLTTEISIFYIDVFVHGVSWCFIAVLLLFHAVSLLFIAVSLLFHGVSSLCFMVFQGVSLPCFILFHDHETGAVGTSLNS